MTGSSPAQRIIEAADGGVKKGPAQRFLTVRTCDSDSGHTFFKSTSIADRQETDEKTIVNRVIICLPDVCFRRKVG
jgi:hypothetical protein